MNNQVNWGIVGLGKIAHKFAADLQHVPNAKLHAVAASDGHRAKQFAQQYGATYSFGSYEAMLNCPHLDVIYNATTNEKHCPTTLLFLRRRIPVLCEKPFALNLAESKLMVETARQNRTFLMEAMWTRFVPAFQKIQNMVAEGAIGRPLSIKADFSYFFPFDPKGRIYDRAQGGGALLDIGIYCVMFAQSFFGKPESMQVMATLNPETGVDDTCALQFQYADGKIALLHTSTQCRMPIEGWILGEKGSIHVPSRFIVPQIFTLAKYNGFEEPQKEIFQMPFEGFGYRFEAEHVQNCLINNDLESPIMPHSFTLDMMQTLDLVREKIGLKYAAD